MVGCPECARGFHAECEHGDECPSCEICNPTLIEEPEIIVESTGKESHYEKFKEFKDPSSTGRHRAALLYPYICDNCEHTKSEHKEDSTCGKEICFCLGYMWKPCEWRNFKNCGGGRNPIVGCGDGVQHDRHHGPIKDPLRNELGNVSLLCEKCHQRWHILNDEYYVEAEFAKLKHSLEPATAKDILDNELRWRDGWFDRNFKLKKISKLDSND